MKKAALGWVVAAICAVTIIISLEALTQDKTLLKTKRRINYIVDPITSLCYAVDTYTKSTMVVQCSDSVVLQASKHLFRFPESENFTDKAE